MPFDGLYLAAIKHELRMALLQGRIEKIHQPEPMEISLLVSRPGERHRLVLSAHPRNARAHLAVTAKENPLTPPLFCMVLRKHLEGARIEDIIQPGLERVLEIRLATRDELGRAGTKSLLVEIMGKHSNIILFDATTKVIIDGIKRYSHSVSRHREVLPGSPYISPPDQGKHNPLPLDEDEFRQILLTEPLNNPLRSILQHHLEGISGAAGLEILARARLPRDQLLDNCGEHEMRLLWQALQSIMEPCRKGCFNPTLALDSRGNPLDFAALNYEVFEAAKSYSDTASKVAERFYSLRRRTELFNGRRNSLLAVIHQNIKRLTKKIAIQESDLARSEKDGICRLYGELLQANLYQLKDGSSEAILENFCEPGAPPLTVPLDPHLTPARNAQAYFKKYLKSKKTRQKAAEQIELNMKELTYLQEVAASLEMAEETADLEEIKQELISQGYLPPEKRVTSPKTKAAAQPGQPLGFTSSGGFLILVGKNNKQNDHLTMKTAGPDDIWLHTKDIPGSHVIIRANGREIPAGTLEEAASLAAYFSKARQGRNVPVDYTLRKYVSKPAGARPGYVIYRHQKTLAANPDPGLIEQLANNQSPATH
jgi:predicted ribosome quality control (RQC) complex YloA/Tae2 family protein